MGTRAALTLVALVGCGDPPVAAVDASVFDAAPNDAPPPLAPGARIAYVAMDGAGVRGLYYRDLSAGGTAVRLDPGAGIRFAPDLAKGFWSPDGSAIAFVAEGGASTPSGLYVVDLRYGGQIEQRLLSGALPSGEEVAPLFEWSPDSSMLLFVAGGGASARWEPYVVVARGPTAGDAARVDPNGPALGVPRSPYSITWSPDSRSFAYAKLQSVGNPSDVYFVTVASGQVGEPVRANPDLATWAGALTPVFAPDASWLGYVANHAHPDRFDAYVTNVSDLEPSVSARLNADIVDGGDLTGINDQWVYWSPDGAWAVYRADAEQVGTHELYAVDLRGEAPAPAAKVNDTLPDNGDVVAAVSWSPNSQCLVYAADQSVDRVGELWIVDMSAASPAAPTRLNDALIDGGDAGDAAWSPTGSHVVFRADQEVDDDYRLYAAAIQDCLPAMRFEVTVDMAVEGDVEDFAWSPDGTRISYRADQQVNDRHDLYVVEISDTGASVPQEASPFSGGVANGARWSADSTFVAYTASFDGTLYATDVSQSDLQPVQVSGVADQTVEVFEWAP